MSSSGGQTDEEYEDFVHSHSASYLYGVCLLLVDLVRQLDHHLLMFFAAIHSHNQASRSQMR